MIYGSMREHEYKLKGCKPEIMTEITTLLHQAYDEEVLTKEDILQIANMSTKSVEELKSECDEAYKNDPLFKILDKIVDDANTGNEAASDLLNIILKAMLKE